jgi:hypothetical protein
MSERTDTRTRRKPQRERTLAERIEGGRRAQREVDAKQPTLPQVMRQVEASPLKARFG